MTSVIILHRISTIFHGTIVIDKKVFGNFKFLICEKEIAAQEEVLAALSKKLEENAADYEKYAALYEEKEREEEKLMVLMERWETLALEAGD